MGQREKAVTGLHGFGTAAMSGNEPLRAAVAGCLSAALLVLTSTAAAGATTRYVASNGADSGTCGAEATPCRSITQAIANAAAGDSISVGPGLYGDINNNGTLGDPGEEPSGACTGSCMVDVNKAVEIFSSDGAGATVVRAPFAFDESYFEVVFLTSPNSEFGRPNKGFTVAGATDSQISGLGVAGLKVAGNRVLAGSATGISLDAADNAAVRSNVVLGDGTGGGSGVRVFGSGVRITGNVATGLHTGLVAGGSNWTMTMNVATDNGIGIEIFIHEGSGLGPPTKFDKNSTVGNYFQGLAVQTGDNPTGGTTMTLGRWNVFGNGEDVSLPTHGLAQNCGLYVQNLDPTDGATVNADGFFWGAAGGPGANPADNYGGGCNDDYGGGITVNVSKSAAKKISIKPPPLR